MDATAVAQALQDLQTEVQRLRQRETELTAQLGSIQTGSAGSAGPGAGLLGELAKSHKELIEALKMKEQVRLVDNKVGKAREV